MPSALTLFALRSTYHKITVRLMVDCDLKDASLTVVYDRRIRRMERIEFWKVDTLEKAQAWLGRLDGNPEYGSWVEATELRCRRDPDFMKLPVDNQRYGC